MNGKWTTIVVAVFFLCMNVMGTDALAVATKKLTVTAGNSKPRVKIHATTPAGQVPVEVKDDEDNRKAVAAVIPDDASSVTITNLDTGRSADVTGPFTADRTVDLATLGLLAGGINSGWADVTKRGVSDWTFDGMIGFGYTTSLGGADASTTASVPGTQRFNGGLDGFSGTTGSLMFRAHLPRNLTGPLGDVWAFFRWNEHFGRTATGAEGDVHPTPGKDVLTKFRRARDLEVGLGKSFETVCHNNGACQYIGVYAGASFQENELTVKWDESGGGGLSEGSGSKTWQTSVVTGAWYQVPLAGMGGSSQFDNLSFILGVDFRRIPNMSVNGQSSTFNNFRYIGGIDPWEVSTWAGLGLAF